MNYKTVFSFGEDNIEAIIDKFSFLMQAPLNKRISDSKIAAVFFGYSLSSRLLFIALVYYLGTVLIINFDLDHKSVYLSV